MSDTAPPSVGLARTGSGNRSLDERSISTRIRLLSQINPYMADRPDALQAMALSPMDNSTLMSTAGQHYAMQVSDQLAGQLKNMTPGAQRAVIAQLTPQQQASLQAMGYQPPQRNQDSGLMGDLIGVGAGALSFVGSGVAAIPGVKEAGGAVLEGLNWVGNWPGHIYRTIRSQDDASQGAGLIGAIAGIAAVALAVPTGGGSLMALGALGLGGLAGGALASAAVAQVTNPGDWARAFGDTWKGEESFDRPSVKRANELLHDGRMRGLAEDLALSNLDIVELAHELAGQSDVSRGSQMHKIEELAASMAQPGTEQYTGAVNSMLNAIQEPVFQRAIQSLSDGKMSPGRDFADILPIEHDSGLYSVLSGGVDAVFTMAVDPTLMLGKANEFYKASRYTLRMFEGAEAATEFLRIAQKPAVLRYHTMIAEAVSKADRGGMQLMRALNPTFERNFIDIVEHARGLVDIKGGGLAKLSDFTVKDLHAYYSEWANLKPALEGIGTVANSKGIQLLDMGVTRAAFHDFRLAARSFTSGLSDVRIEKHLIEKAEQHGAAILNTLPDEYRATLTSEGLIDKPWKANQAAPTAYAAGRAFAETPLVGRVVGKMGDVATALSTMSLSGKAVALTGPKVAQDVRALSEMGRYMGMPSWARQAWADAMIASDSTAERVMKMNGWLGNMLKLTGADQTDEGARIINEYLQRSKQLYSSVDDTLMINGRRVHLGLFTNDQADMVVMPNVGELLRASKTSVIATKVMGISDLSVFEAGINKVWKPIILLRLGFIPRAAGEELAGFLARGGIGSLTQEFGGRYLGKLRAYEDALRKQSAQMAGAHIALTIDERALLDGGLRSVVPQHVKPIMRMLSWFGWEDPAVHRLAGYGKWLAKHLESGASVLDPVERKLANFAGQALDAPRNPLAIARAENASNPMQRATQIASERLAADQRRLNLAQYADSILLGNQYSIRRMLMGGVHDDLVHAGAAWASVHATTVMREASAVNAGPIAPNYDGNDLASVLLPDKEGTLRPTVVHRTRGERIMVGYNDGAYTKGVHDTALRTLDNALMQRVTPTILSRVRGNLPVSEERLGGAADALLGLGRMRGDTRLITNDSAANHARAMAVELIGGADEHTWRALRKQMSQSTEGRRYAETLEAYLPEQSTYTVDDVAGAFELAAKDARGELPAEAELRRMASILRSEVKPITTWLDSLDPASRAFAEQFLHQTAVGGSRSWRAQHLATQAHHDKRVADSLGALDESGLNLHQLAWERTRAEQGLGGDLTSITETERKAQAAHQALRTEHDAAVITRADSNTWLYGSLDEAQPDILRELRSGLMDPNLHDEHVSASLRSLQLDEKGQFVDTQHRNATVMLYEVKPMQDETFDSLLARSANPAILNSNRPLVQRILSTHRSRDTQLVADYELASELSKLRTQAAGIDVTLAARPRMMRQPRRVTSGRPEGMLSPDGDTKVDGMTQLWTFPTAGADVRLLPTPDAAIDPIEAWTQQQYSKITEALGRGRRQTIRAKMKPGDPLLDGSPTSTSLVYRWNKDGSQQLEPVLANEVLHGSDAPVLRDYRGQSIGFGDPAFFEAPLDVSPGDGGDVMWEMVGPMMRDKYDELYGATRFRTKDASVALTKHAAPRQVSDLVPVQRSKSSDVMKIPQNGLPEMTVAQVMNNVHIGKWEEVVKFGFDRVIGPSIDAIVRKPMAFHAFAQRYTAGKKSLRWALDPDLIHKTEAMMRDWGALAAGVELDTNHLTDIVRSVASFHTNDVRAKEWTVNQSLAWLRGHSDGELQDILTRVATRSKTMSTPEAKLANAYGKQLSRFDHAAIKKATSMGTTPEEFVTMIESKLPAGALNNTRTIMNAHNQEAVRADDLLGWLQANNKWDDVIAMRSNMEHIERTVGESAAAAAIADVVPFLDSHEFKTQFADYGKGFMPFWYAEENFMKRWARGLAEQGPQLIRKAQLTYMGMKHAGIVRTDSSGKDWFVYPGSGLLTEAISKMVPGLSSIYDVGVMFQSPTDQMLPGMSNKIAAPSFNPLVTIPMDLVTTWMPELQPIERSMLGDFASQRAVIDQVYPAHFRNLIEAFTGSDDSNTRYASAQMSAIAYMEAHDQGLPDNATAGQTDEYMRRIREHARIIVIAQALAGFVTPGSPSTTEADASADLTGIGITDPADVLSDEYLTLVRLLGVEDGTAKFLEMNKDATLDDISNPLAYTTPRNVSRSGAPLPSTEGALEFSIRNEDYLKEFPNAAPWLLPQEFEKGVRSEYAYTQQTINGLRRRRTPEEYLRAMKFKEGASEYFIMRDEFLTQIANAEIAQNKTRATAIRTEMDRTLLIYRTAHPVFREELESSDGRTRRKAILTEMQSVINDPQAPDTPQTRAISTAMQAFNTYRVQLATLADNRSNVGRREIENLKAQYSTYMATFTKANPGIMSFWKSVLQPESSLD